MSTIECIWRVHTEALLTCLRVIDNWQNVFAMLIFCQLVISSFAGKKQILLIFYANLHHNSYIHEKEGVACLTWLSVKILWTGHVLKLHENLIISSSELNDKWEILIFTVVLDKIHSCASQDWHPLRHIDFTATLDLDRHRNDIS